MLRPRRPRQGWGGAASDEGQGESGERTDSVLAACSDVIAASNGATPLASKHLLRSTVRLLRSAQALLHVA